MQTVKPLPRANVLFTNGSVDTQAEIAPSVMQLQFQDHVS